ncbi:MAG: hypothetical protein KF851_03165 [Pirellulaceae bacterium]|nr:hypothetical protein [Pirellulaceae bacterium]
MNRTLNGRADRALHTIDQLYEISIMPYDAAGNFLSPRDPNETVPLNGFAFRE